MPKILITGANGQLGKACLKILTHHQLIPLSHHDLDITDNSACKTALETHRPNIIIHAAASTNVKSAEQNPQAAFSTNTIGTYNLIQHTDPRNTRFIYISTDFVFDGNSSKPYTEQDIPNPIIKYGYSKLAGEYIVRETLPNHLILRTAWVFGDGKNFIQTILKLTETKDTLPIVSDQIGSPTFTEDLAQWIDQCISKETTGTYHAVNDGYTTWADLAREALRLKDKNTTVKGISSTEYAQLFNDHTPRPKYSALDNSKLKQIVQTIQHWQSALQTYLRE